MHTKNPKAIQKHVLKCRNCGTKNPLKTKECKFCGVSTKYADDIPVYGVAKQ